MIDQRNIVRFRRDEPGETLWDRPIRSKDGHSMLTTQSSVHLVYPCLRSPLVPHFSIG